MNITIIRKSKLEQKEWDFYLFERGNDFEIRFARFYISTRTTKRHKFKVDKIWSRGQIWGNNIELPEVPPDVKAELRTKVKEFVDKAEIK